MPDKTWKATERRIAKDMGTQRIPVSGRRQDKHGADIEDEMFLVQVKDGYSFPKYLRTWLSGIVNKAKAKGKIGIVVWHPKGGRFDDALVLVRWGDWRDLHGSGVSSDEG